MAVLGDPPGEAAAGGGCRVHLAEGAAAAAVAGLGRRERPREEGRRPAPFPSSSSAAAPVVDNKTQVTRPP